MAGLIVFDASVLIAYLDDDDAHHDAAHDLLEREVDDDFAVPTLTLAEIFVGPARIGMLDDARLAIEQNEVSIAAPPDDEAGKLARLRAETSLKLPDCVVLLAAEHLRARLATFDDRLGRSAKERGVEIIR